MQRKSIYAQLQSQIQSMEESMKDQEGTIETLERQLVQAGIKDKINEQTKQIDQELTQTQQEQRLLRGRMKDAVELTKKELTLAKKNSVDNKKK